MLTDGAEIDRKDDDHKRKITEIINYVYRLV